MATLTNGDAAAHAADTTDTAPTDAVSNKRKRHDETTSGEEASRVKRLQKDILDVLSRHDTEPSFLNHNIPPAEPSQKKAKLSATNNEQTSIAARLRSTSYTSLHGLRKDANSVSDDLITGIRTKARERTGFTAGRPTVEELKQINKIQSLDNLVQEIVEREHRSDDVEDQQLKKEDSGLANGHSATADSTRGGTVLTLFGNALTAKQLFSSLQQPADRRDPLIKTELPVEELSLPNGISATKVAPVAVDNAQKAPTFEQAFAPPYSLATLQPPKTHKRSATRDQSVTWEFKDPIQRNKRGGYTVQPLSTGTWLGYGGVDPLDTAQEKRKQRDRALSSSDGVHRKDATDSSEEALKKREEALFRRAYSSFAPPKDNSNAIIPEEVKNMVWWHKVGEKRYNEIFAIDPALLDEDAQASKVLELQSSVELQEDEFSRVLEDLDELERAEEEQSVQAQKDKTDVEQVLREVSELLETLASHQRIRNTTLSSSSTAARTPISPGPIVTSQIGKPDEPSEQETATYHNLRRELAYLLLKLPPYAIAKLDGDQLADLGVKTLIPYETKDIRGSMEEDLIARQAKLAAMTTANSIANLTRPNSSTSAQRYSQTPQGTPAIGAAAHTRYGSTYNSRAPAAATPTFQRQQSNPSTYSTMRQSYGTQPQQYTRPGAAQPGYGQTNAQQYYAQRPAQQTPGTYNNYNQQYQQTPVQNQQYARTPIMGNYQTNGAQQQAYNRTASPAKPGFPAPQANVQRPMYPAPQQQPGSGRATPVSYPSNPHTPVNGYPPPARPVQGLAPRPTSTTPQPTNYNGPTQPPPPQQVVANGNGNP
ncbi:hypothetical protein CB0940_05334 [Cercospora beticola]|uniref:Uncharacterized protein n=1 Tax=Cercospora beticola TaxID=122368 RepID=A0A2G5HZW1_CERBT|nr:hypothetical protein CB0940_05334 [Cercospora beticola]PIA98068.1 hypothetical protein CB0940_05334 [Cercospora beticola]WPA97871.1 hypothetical protein RHO25_002482 [Cercospora beticola]